MKREIVESSRARFLGFFENQSPEWYEQRKGRIGGSQIGAALGLSPWESPVTVFFKVRGEVEQQPGESVPMKLGTLLEDPLLQVFASENPTFDVFKSGSYTANEYEWILGNPDAFYRDEQGVHLIEVKTTSDFWDSVADVPPNYLAQIQSYLWLFELEHCKLVALCAGRYKTFDVYYDPFVAEANLSALRAFWAGVEADEPPTWDGSESTYETMRLKNTQILPDDIEELGDLGMYLALAYDELELAKEKYRELQSRTLDALGNAKWGAVNDEIVLYRTRKGQGAPYLSWKKKGKK